MMYKKHKLVQKLEKIPLEIQKMSVCPSFTHSFHNVSEAKLVCMAFPYNI